MIIYRFRQDMVFDCEVEVPDGTTAIPKYHTFQAPPVQEGYYAVMANGWILVEGEKPTWPPPVDPEVERFMYNEQQKRNRAQAYERESDPLFFKVQRGEATMQEWLDLVEQIKQRFPYK